MGGELALAEESAHAPTQLTAPRSCLDAFDFYFDGRHFTVFLILTGKDAQHGTVAELLTRWISASRSTAVA